MLASTVIDRIRKADPDRYRSALLADAQVRDDLCVLYAFHLELAKVPELVSEPMIGAIRYQWWRDAVDEIYTEKPVRAHEIATPLTDVLRRTQTPRYRIDRLIDARERDLDPTPFGTLEDAVLYCRQTSGTLLQIALGMTKAPDFDGAERLGLAWGLTGLARAWPYYHNTMLQGLSFDALIASANTAMTQCKDVPAQAMPAVAYTALVPGYIRRMSRASYEPAHTVVHYPRLSKQFCILRATLSGRLGS